MRGAAQVDRATAEPDAHRRSFLPDREDYRTPRQGWGHSHRFVPWKPNLDGGHGDFSNELRHVVFESAEQDCREDWVVPNRPAQVAARQRRRPAYQGQPGHGRANDGIADDEQVGVLR